METRAAKLRRLNSIVEIKQECIPNNPELGAPKVKITTLKTAKEIKNEILSNDEVDKAPTVLKVEIQTKMTMYKTPDDTLSSAVEILNMKALIASFDGDHPDNFFEHCRNFMNSSTMNSVEVLTIEQADTPLWHLMRFGRITASRVHQASRCKTKNGSLVDSIMGKRSGWSFAMQRGTDLEDKVFNVLKKEMSLRNVKLKQCGLFLDSHLPHFAASPDGISDEFVVEIKCPATPKTHAEYINIQTLQRKYYGQIQLQMYVTKRKKALLGVADLNFEQNKKVTKVWIDYDENYVNDLIEDANNFWIDAVFPLLKRKRTSFY